MAGADDSDLERALAELYRGPLEDFVRRRDALSKELRAAGKREQATTVKGLGKPSRTAWALNLGVLGDGEALGPVVAAVGETVDAQACGGDVRAAIARLRTTVRDFAGKAAAASEAGGYGVAAGVLANALFAALGNAESLGQLRRGRLTDVPEAGGLDLLNALLAPGSAGAGESSPRAQGAAPPSPPPPPKAVADDAVAREAVRRTAAALATARELGTASQAALRSVEAKLAAAEARLQAADVEARTLRAEHDRARQAADAAASQERAAETAAADAERQLDETRGQNR